MELLLKIGEPGLIQHILIYGEKYTLYRDGEYLGEGIYDNDPMHGNGFFRYSEHEGIPVIEPFCVDEWILKQ